MQTINKILILFLLLFTSVSVYFALSSSLRGEVITYNKTSHKITAYDKEQLLCLVDNIYYEAGHEPLLGKLAVAQVTINRVESELFPSDVCGVVKQKTYFNNKTVCQFSWYCERRTKTKKIDPHDYAESYRVAYEVYLEKYELPSLEKALYYHADYVSPGWKKNQIVKIGRHIFYEQ